MRPSAGPALYASDGYDLAFLAVATPLSPLPLAEPIAVRRGQQLIAIGSLGVGDRTIRNAVAVGTLSGEFPMTS